MSNGLLYNNVYQLCQTDYYITMYNQFLYVILIMVLYYNVTSYPASVHYVIMTIYYAINTYYIILGHFT